MLIQYSDQIINHTMADFVNTQMIRIYLEIPLIP